MTRRTLAGMMGGAWRTTVPTATPRRPPGPGPVPDCPPGWHTAPPDFVGVGSKKAGTGWWHHLITAHPAVHLRAPAVPGLDPPGVKELHFFQGQWDAGLAGDVASAYHRYFPRPPSKLVGEWTPRYMLDVWTPPQLRLAAPDARILVMVRDPVERFRSGVSHYLARHDGIDHPRVLTDEVEHGRYAAGLLRVTRCFPRDQVLVLQYERCVREPEAELRRTYRFLGLPDVDFVPDAISRPVNGAMAEKITLGDDLAAELAEEYRADVLQLAETWPVDLSLWRNFAHLGGGRTS